MIYRLLADLLVLAHLIFVVFVVAGGYLALRWRRLAWIHLPVAAWGFAISVFGWVCPLTPLENRLRRLGGEPGYAGSFIDHYVIPILYPPGLTRPMQWGLAAGVLAVNLIAYGLYFRARSS